MRPDVVLEKKLGLHSTSLIATQAGTIVHALDALVLGAMSASFDTVTDHATTHTSSAGAGGNGEPAHWFR